MGWSKIGSRRLPATKPFQSLRGFGVGWSVKCAGGRSPKSLFQSLRGFGVGWSASNLKHARYWKYVSIPERVWGGLELAAAIG